MERGLASFDIYVIVSELQELIGCYVEKIYQLSRDEILLRVQQKTADQKEFILVRNGELLCLTQKQFDMPEKPSLFAMTLRKYLLNGRISEITQHEFDRIIKIKVGRKEGDYTLVCELFTNGNVILVNPEGRIIRPLIKQEWSHRLIKSGEMYLPPPAQTNPFLITEQEFQELVKGSKKDLVRTLATTLNLSGLYAEELCVRAGVEKNRKIDELDEVTIKKLFAELQRLLLIFKEKKFQPVFVKKNGVVVDILPFPFQSYTDVEFEQTESFNRELLLCCAVRKPKKQVESASQKKKEKLQRQLVSQQELIEKFRKTIEQKKREGDLIYLNFHACERLLSEIMVLLKQKEKREGIERICRNPLVKQFDPTADELIVMLPDGKGNTVDVDLDFRKSVSENAQQAYGESKQFQEKVQGAQVAVEQTKRELETIVETDVVEEKKIVKREKVLWFERFRWFVSTEGNLVVAGKDVGSNEVVVKKYLSEGDRYAHADIHGAPSCVIKSRGIHDERLAISEKTLEEACVFAASYSRAWNQFGEAQAYWVLPEQVSKTPESGEYVPKGAFIIRGKRNYVRCKLEVAVGLVPLGDGVKVMGGPVVSVAARTDKYIVLVPGVLKKSVVAQKLAYIFQVSTDAVEKVLPPGNLTVVKTIGFELR
jgi:predicted ribosome quality control (RQC) complex YloA/Tae2 family protein